MCRWGCSEKNMSFKCKYCGTNYCKACKRGEFHGEMFTPDTCRVCNQQKCQGEMINKPKPDGANQAANHIQATRRASKCVGTSDGRLPPKQNNTRRRASLQTTDLKPPKRVITRRASKS